jgi:hypothetical protein
METSKRPHVVKKETSISGRNNNRKTKRKIPMSNSAKEPTTFSASTGYETIQLL